MSEITVQLDHSPGEAGLTVAVTEASRIGSVVIPAHNEATVIRRCLDALFVGMEASDLDVVVVCNGCADGTAAMARASGHPVRVLELSERSKAAALRAGDQATVRFPRIYLDADVILQGPAARSLLARLDSGAVAARPPIVYDSASSSRLVRGYYRARSRIPSVHAALWGAGVYGLSERGRGRFHSFPDLIGDDLWVDRHFRRGEVEIIDAAPVLVRAPRRTRDLVRVLRRTYRGKRELRPVIGRDSAVATTTRSTVRDLRRLLRGGPGSALDAATYAGFAIAGRVALRLMPADGGRWERDHSSRAQ
jgi:glycosyltransferase involved in cell wall biosynthesis